MTQSTLFPDCEGPKKPLANRRCSKCQREWYPSQLIVTQSKIPGHKGYTVSCPSCFAVLEQRRKKPAKLNSKCEQLVTASKIKGTLIDQAFDTLSRFSLRPEKCPWEWLELRAPLLVTGIENQITTPTRLRELSGLKRQATRQFKALSSEQVKEIAHARREFAEELKQFCKRLGLELISKNGTNHNNQ